MIVRFQILIYNRQTSSNSYYLKERYISEVPSAGEPLSQRVAATDVYIFMAPCAHVGTETKALFVMS